MSDDTDFPTCETCEHWKMWEQYDPDHPAYVEGHVDPVRGDYSHSGLNIRFTPKDFGCILHSALQDQQDDE